MKTRRQASGVRRRNKRDSDEKHVAALKRLRSIGYFKQLDDILSPKSGKAKRCRHDYRYTKQLLIAERVENSGWADIFDVLRFRGGFCDCEVLYNVAARSRLKSKYWKAKYAELTKKPLP